MNKGLQIHSFAGAYVRSQVMVLKADGLTVRQIADRVKLTSYQVREILYPRSPRTPKTTPAVLVGGEPGQTLTWPENIVWPDGDAPTLSPTKARKP